MNQHSTLPRTPIGIDLRVPSDREIIKSLRKYAFDKMIELEMPESVADFIEGRVPRTIGAMHYLGLRQKAIHFYPRYCNYLKKLRRNLYTHNLEMMNNEIISHNISI